MIKGEHYPYKRKKSWKETLLALPCQDPWPWPSRYTVFYVTLLGIKVFKKDVEATQNTDLATLAAT